MSDHHDPHDYPCVQWMLTRRAFLKGATMSAAMAPLLSSCEFVDVFDTEVVDSIEFDLNEADYEALKEVGGIACAEAGAIALILVRDADDSVLAFDRKCPHNNLSMGPCEEGSGFESGTWLQAERQLRCNFHGSVFGENGDLVKGPSPRGITRYPVEFDAMTGRGKVQVV